MAIDAEVSPVLVKPVPATEAKIIAKQADDGRGDQGPAADEDGLRGHAERAQAEQQPERRVQAQRRGPARDRAAQAAAVIGPGNGGVKVDVHADRVLDHEQHEDRQAAAPQPGRAAAVSRARGSADSIATPASQGHRPSIGRGLVSLHVATLPMT